MDGGFVKSLGKITDMICLSLLFIIFSIPVVYHRNSRHSIVLYGIQGST